MIRSGVITVLFLLIVHTDAYRDYLTHTALDKVPAQLGESLEIRCTKIIEKSQYDYIQSADCSSWRGNKCRHVWSKDGKVLNPSNKYRMKSSITFDYCETFEWTTDIVRSMQIPAADGSSGSYRGKEDRSMKCFASALVIRDVTTSDLGEYQCKLTSEDGGSSDSRSNVQKITVYNEASPVTLPKKIEYFENFYTKGIRSKLLMQCVVTGGPVQWFVRFASKECSRWDEKSYYGNDCVNETIKPIESVDKIHGWRCFNYTISSHQPYNMNQVTESFIYFENICELDWAGVYCSVDSDAKVRSEVGELVMKDDWNFRDYYPYQSEEVIAALGYVMLPTVLSIFFIVAAILACVRGKVSNCCGNSYRYSSVSPLTQTYSYVVPLPPTQMNQT